MPRLGILVTLLCLLLPGVAHAVTGQISVFPQQSAGSVQGKITGPGINCPTDCFDSHSWAQGGSPTVTLVAAPNDGWAVSWESGCTPVDGRPNECTTTYGVPDEFGDGTEVYVAFYELDRTGPSVEVVAPGNLDRQFGAKDTITAKLRAADPAGVDRVEFTLDGKKLTDSAAPAADPVYEASWKAADITHGGHDIVMVAFDEHGNSTSRAIPITVDKNPPTIAFTGGVAHDAWHGKGAAEVTFTAGFDAVTVECSLAKDATMPAYGPCTAMSFNNGRHSATPSSDGTWHFFVRVVDGEGNDAVAGRRFRVDTTNPDIGIEGGPSGTVVQQGKATPIRGHLTDASTLVLNCRVDGGAWRNCGNQVWQAEPNAAEGVRTWAFSATDAAGNTTTVSKSWRIDGTGPAIALADGPAEGAIVAPGVHGYRVTAEDAVTGAPELLCAWDDEALEPCPFRGATSRDLGPGVHRLRVRAVDGVGNVSTVTRTFTVKAPATGGDGGDSGGKGGGDTGGGQTGGDTGNPAPPPNTGTTPPLPPSTGSPRADRTAPVLTVSAPKTVKSSRLRRGLALTVGCSEACTGTVTLAGPKGLRASVRITGAGRVSLKLKTAALKKALRGRKRATFTVTVGVSDAAGNPATRKVTLTATA
jgi:hypothetical protein